MACAAPGPPMTLFSCRCSVKRLRSFVSEHTCDVVAFKAQALLRSDSESWWLFCTIWTRTAALFVKEKLLFVSLNLTCQRKSRWDLITGETTCICMLWGICSNLHIYVWLATKIYADIMTPQQAVFSIDLTCTKKYIQHRFNMANMRCR